MTKLLWDQTSERTYETGVDHGVLFVQNSAGAYPLGVAWNGLTAVTESPSGAEASPLYADNIKYLNLMSVEELAATIEAYTYPEEFGVCDGTVAPYTGVLVGQQTRKTFGLAYRTQIGNDVEGTDFGYKLHLVYGCLAAPSEKAYATVNDTPEAITFSWAITTSPVEIPDLKKSAMITINSTKVDADALSDLEDALFGTVGVDARLPLPTEVMAFFSGTVSEVIPTEPTMSMNDITIPTITGVVYTINGETVSGIVTIQEDVMVVAYPDAGYKFPDVVDNDWYFEYSA